jgi:NAD(P)-dependent dehydrogenase (short-subunit alcohol dehydrogenase family)
MEKRRTLDSGERRVWFVTGASSGIGLSVARQALDAGEIVAAIFRTAEQADAYSRSVPGRSLGFVADVTDREQVDAAVQSAGLQGGHIDVVVNAAGYAIVGAVEELSDAEMFAQLNVNLLGTHRVVRSALPWLRARSGSRIVNISSVAGQVGYPGMGAYDASKGGLELLSEALQIEVAPFGIRVVIVEPGNVRTEWTGRSMVFAKESLSSYEDTAGTSRQFFAELHGHQDGDPEVVAAVIRDAVSSDNPPLRLVVGADAHQWITDKLEVQVAELARWRPSTPST